MVFLRNIIDKHHHQILGVSEANLLDVHGQSLVAIPHYNLHFCPTMQLEIAEWWYTLTRI